jgi:hypothetical protein
MPVKEFTDIIMGGIEGALRPLGYRRRGSAFSAQLDDMIAMVQVQKSQSTTRDRLVFTVNLGLFSRPLARKLGRDTDKPSFGDVHWQARIGFLTPERADRWWEARSDAEAAQAAEEVGQALVAHAVPALGELGSTEKLCALWRSGPTRGTMDWYRKEYLRLLAEPDAGSSPP